MVKIYYDKDADAKILKGKRIAVMGYGSQGHAHANKLRDSGADVIIGVKKGGAGWGKAEKAGFQVYVPSEAAKKADIIMMLVPLFNVAADVLGVPVLYAYIFAAWGLLVALMALVVESRR